MIIGLPIFGDTSTFINTAYLDYISSAEFEPMLLNEYSNEERMVDMCDGLLLPGGGDLDPLYYGDNNVSSYKVDPDKDAFERNWLHRFIEAKKPILGICRGFQMVVREFVLPKFHDKLIYYQHMGGHSQTGDNKAARHLPSHFVAVDVHALYDPESNVKVDGIPVNSMHHQGLVARKKAKIKPGTVMSTDNMDINIVAITTYSTPSNCMCVIEGVEIPNLKITAVQWHPEELVDTDLLIHAMRKYDG